MKELKIKAGFILRGYKMLNNLVPRFLPVATARSVFLALLPFVNIIASAMILNALSARRPMEHVLMIAIVAAGCNFLARLAAHALNGLADYYSAGVWTLVDRPLNDKQQDMDYAQIENPETRLLRQKIFTFHRTDGSGIANLYWHYGGMITNFLTVVFSIGVFASVFASAAVSGSGFVSFLGSPWAAALLLVIILGNSALNMRVISKRTQKSHKALEGFHFPFMIWQYLYENMINKYQMGKECKISHLRHLLMSTISGVMASTQSVVKSFGYISARYQSLMDLSSNALSAIVYIFVIAKAVLGGFGVGSIVQYVGGITRFNAGISGLASNIAGLFSNVEALKLYFEFLDMPDKVYHGTLPVEKRRDYEYEIEFHDVSFQYPGSDAYALRNLNMKLNIGQRLAVVGMNGSGKTTMIKLLCRLYDPTEGNITLNGIDIKKYNYAEYMGIFSVVFQDFNLFSFSLGQNVAVSTNVNNDKAAECLKRAGFASRLETLPLGLDTPLYKDFSEDGVEISGGEAQKIALARALYKDAPFVILDEPTAALDPVSEYETYSKFNETVGEKTAVFISHRLSSCRFCHDIAVFHEGRLIQRGSHETLIADELGKYHQLWNAQAQYYTEEYGEEMKLLSDSAS